MVRKHSPRRCRQRAPSGNFSTSSANGAKALSSKMSSEGPFGQFQHFQRKFKRFEFFRCLKRRETRLAEKWGIRPRLYLLICQNLTSISESALETCCERTSFFDIFCRKNLCPSSAVSNHFLHRGSEF